MLIKNCNPTITIKSNYIVSNVTHLLSEESEGLEPIVSFNVASKVMLTRNLWIKHGICNGATGFVKDVIYVEGRYPPSLPIAGVVHFLNCQGPTLAGCFPITTNIFKFQHYRQHGTTSVATEIMLGNYNSQI